MLSGARRLGVGRREVAGRRIQQVPGDLPCCGSWMSCAEAHRNSGENDAVARRLLRHAGSTQNMRTH